MIHKYRGFTIKVLRDDDYESPDEWGNDDVFLVYDDRSFSVQRNGFNPAEIWSHFNDEPHKHKLYNGYYVFEVYAYIHSGVALSLGRNGWPFNCPWDTSMKGFALIKRAKGAYKEEKARKLAEGLIKLWNDYLSGNVYGFDVVESGDSCWGYYGDPEDSGLLEDAKSSIDHTIQVRLKKRQEELKNQILAKVPIQYRKEFDLLAY